MKINKKFLLGIFAISMACIILQPNKVNAALQSNGGTPATKSLSNWMLQIRQMQELGGTLGRTDIVNTTDLTSNATDLDIHMQKNTEYGAMAILSASAYGNPNPIKSGETTTGNSTGILMRINTERVAAAYNGLFGNISNRYKNAYSYNYVPKIGDAIVETQGWHSSGISRWFYSNPVAGTVLRSLSGSIFSYDSYATSSEPAVPTKKWASRAVIVVGTGI